MFWLILVSFLQTTSVGLWFHLGEVSRPNQASFPSAAHRLVAQTRARHGPAYLKVANWGGSPRLLFPIFICMLRSVE